MKSVKLLMNTPWYGETSAIDIRRMIQGTRAPCEE